MFAVANNFNLILFKFIHVFTPIFPNGVGAKREIAVVWSM